MTDNIIQPDDINQQKTNRNLAIWIGGGGVGSFALLYVLFFLVMIMRPGLMFKLMPMPMPIVIDKAISDGNRAYLVHQQIDMSTINHREKHEPHVKHVLSVLNGTELGASQEISAYTDASGGGNRLLFLSKGSYRIYDGSRWIEERSEAIGKDPKGVLTPAGVYVLSGFDAGQRLTLIATGAAIAIPLPADYLAWYKCEQCPCAKLVWYGERLCLFWKGKDSISWTMWDGNAWAPTGTSPYAGGYEVAADNRNLYLFYREGEGCNRRLTYYVLTNNAWSGPMNLPVKGSFTNWDVFIQQGKLKLFLQQFTTNTFYTIEKDALVDPVRLKGPFDPVEMIVRTALWSAGTVALSFLFVLGISAVIRRFKKRIWREETVEYEFASLFRRFIALMIDKLLLFIPPGIVIALFFRKMDTLADDPLYFMAPIFFAFSLFFVGSFLYHSLLEGLYGQTLGKRICGIRVVKSDFTPCGLGAGFLRNLMRIADAFFYYLVAVIALAASFKWQRVGDLVADTVVVRWNRR
jgi:uncharacterized RDD family membrane protein YckC